MNNISHFDKIARCTKNYSPALLSGLMLSFAFSPLEWSYIAWIAFVPLLYALYTQRHLSPFRQGWIAGMAFWLPGMFWLTHVTWIGWFTLCCYCALYFIPFSWGLAVLFRKTVPSHRQHLATMLLAATVWTGSEYARSILFTGFAWNPLGLSQHSHLALLQHCQWGGISVLSGLIVFVNMAIFFTLMSVITKKRTFWHIELFIGLLVLAGFQKTGSTMLREAPTTPESTLTIAMVQPNIPQDQKWFTGHPSLQEYETYCSRIYTRLSSLSQTALHMPGVQLIVWPETSLPDDVRTSPSSYDVVLDVVTNGTELLLGSTDTEWLSRDHGRYFNSAFHFNTQGTIEKYYDKQHLVLFGEYIPLLDRLPWIKAISPISDNFSAGTNTVIFKTDTTPFSVLICFEDTIERIARDAVNLGARILFNLTNDAWFDVSCGSRQHMLHLLLRCVENGVPAARCANTGMTCTIDAQGRITRQLEVNGKSTCIAGVLASQITVTPEARTFYSVFGYLIGRIAFFLALVIMLTLYLMSGRRESCNH